MENKQGVVEKRIKPGIIRRRAKAEAEAPAPAEAAATPEAAPAEEIVVEPMAEAIQPEPQAPEAPVQVEEEAPPPVEAKAPVEKSVPTKVVEPAKAAPSKTSKPRVEEPKVVGPRALPEGPPVGTIIQLPHMKRKPDGTVGPAT